MMTGMLRPLVGTAVAVAVRWWWWWVLFFSTLLGGGGGGFVFVFVVLPQLSVVVTFLSAALPSLAS